MLSNLDVTVPSWSNAKTMVLLNQRSKRTIRYR